MLTLNIQCSLLFLIVYFIIIVNIPTHVIIFIEK